MDIVAHDTCIDLGLLIDLSSREGVKPAGAMSVLAFLIRNNEVKKLSQLLEKDSEAKIQFLIYLNEEVCLHPKRDYLRFYELITKEFLENIEQCKITEDIFRIIQNLVWNKAIAGEYHDLMLISEHFAGDSMRETGLVLQYTSHVPNSFMVHAAKCLSLQKFRNLASAGKFYLYNEEYNGLIHLITQSPPDLYAKFSIFLANQPPRLYDSSMKSIFSWIISQRKIPKAEKILFLRLLEGQVPQQEMKTALFSVDTRGNTFLSLACEYNDLTFLRLYSSLHERSNPNGDL